MTLKLFCFRMLYVVLLLLLHLHNKMLSSSVKRQMFGIINYSLGSNFTPNYFILKFTQPPSVPLLRKRINLNFKSTTGINSFNVINFFYSHTLI